MNKLIEDTAISPIAGTCNNRRADSRDVLARRDEKGLGEA